MNWFKGNTDTNVYLEECETPTREQEYKDLAENTLNVFLDLEKGSDEWTLLSSSDNIQVFEKGDTSGFSCIKTQGILPCSPRFIYNKIWSDDLKTRQQWEPELKELKVIETITNDIQVSYRAYSAPYPVAPREFLVMNARKVLDNGQGYAIFGTSINHSYTHPDTKCVRGNAVVSGLLFRPVRDSPHTCLAIRIVHIDPKGMIPPMIVSLTKKRAGQLHETLRKLIGEIYVPEKEVEVTQQKPEKKGKEPIHEREISTTTTTHQLRSTTGKQEEEDEEEEEKEEEEEGEEFEDTVESQFEETPSENHVRFETKKLKNSSQIYLRSSVSRSELQATLKAIQTLLQTLQLETKLNSERLQKMESSLHVSIAAPPAHQPGVVAAPKSNSLTRVGIRSLGYDLLFFILVWPLVAIKLYKYIQTRFPRQS